jgi:hypothetical protein
MLAALLGAAALTAAVGRKAGGRAGELSELAGVLLLCQPQNCFVLDLGWTEPLLCFAVAACLWSAAYGRCRLLAAALAVVVGVKQYGLLLAVPLWPSRRLTWRVIAGAAAGVAAVTLPFVLWDAPAFRRGVVRFHTDSAFRPNSLTVPAAVASYCGYRLPGALGLAAALAVALAAFACRASSPAQATVDGAAVLLAFFLFGKAGHLNYYWLVGSLLPMAVAVSCADPGEAALKAAAQRGK